MTAARRVSSEIAVRLLGPLEVELAGRRVRFEGVKQRKLFMVLALRAPDAVSADELMREMAANHIRHDSLELVDRYRGWEPVRLAA